MYALLLGFPDEEEEACTSNDEYGFRDEMVLTKGFVNIPTRDTSRDIRYNIIELFNKKYPEIKVDDFTYLKRERQKLSVPLVPNDWEWNFENLKLLMGQGKLYCRLVKPFSTFC